MKSINKFSHYHSPHLSFRFRETTEMAAYAALLSLTFTIKQIQQHPRPPISLHQQHLLSLTHNLSFLQNFLETHSKEEDELESRIADAAYAAEDVIESHIVDQIHGENIDCVDFYRDLERAIQEMDLITKEVMQIVKEKKIESQHSLQVSIGLEKPNFRMQSNAMVDFGDILNDVMYKLTRQECNLEIVPIVGMGGIGKTTLARNIYAHPLIVEHFDVLAWVTISQEYSRRDILLVLCAKVLGSVNGMSEMSEDQLGEIVYKNLCGRRYLIVMDDIWSIEAWDKVKRFFPKNNNGSKIMITTRLTNLAFSLSYSLDFQMNLLNEDKSWDLLREVVFGKEDCPIELEGIGKKIARNCRGLPLSIVVIGGLLAKSKMTQEYWEQTLGNLNSVINLENNEQCLQILRMSYKELPVHLKPCFLYMGVFPEDEVIHVPELSRLWVSEGILKPIEDKSLEEVAKEYIKELIDRNLILVHELRWNGKAKSCKIHDLLRDVCLREAQKQRFLYVLRSQDVDIPEGINMERRICIHKNTKEKCSSQYLHALESMSPTARSLLLMIRDPNEQSPSPRFRLLRAYSRSILDSRQSVTSVEDIVKQANLRYISIHFFFPRSSRFPSCSLLWNLQTFKISNIRYSIFPVIAPFEIWEMPLLRHVMFHDLQLELPDAPCGEDHSIVLENLQTLSGIGNFKCSEEVVKRIPNIKKLRLVYERDDMEGLSDFCLNNLERLQKLQSLRLWLDLMYPISDLVRSNLAQNLNFPHSLKKLTLRCINLFWEELNAKIGSLPLLEVLKLENNSCIGPKWETMEGKFCSLKFLRITGCDLKCWTTDDTHFPRLEHLVLEHLNNLEEVPSSVGDIPTLQSIQLNSCSKSAEDSAERIKEEQEDNGNEGLKVGIGKN